MADDDFEDFVHIVDPQLRRALAGHLPQDQVADAISLDLRTRVSTARVR